jgi:hypothetical protein
MQLLHAIDVEQVAADAADLRAHAVEHVAELLQVGLARRIEDRGAPFGEHPLP